LATYKQKIEDELFNQCLSIVNLVKDKCIRLAANSESKAFFLKMAGDYYRYIAESAQGDKLNEVKNGALEYYTQASEISNKDLGACNPIRLGLALNFSVFYYEVMNNHKRACELGESALQSALDKIDECDEETFRDAKSIIELLKENLSLWKEEDAEGNNEIEDL
jgi:14-3-3 protein epsilon